LFLQGLAKSFSRITWRAASPIVSDVVAFDLGNGTARIQDSHGCEHIESNLQARRSLVATARSSVVSIERLGESELLLDSRAASGELLFDELA
jgi:hypothetical protein